MEALDKKLNDIFAGKVVRKDLTKLVKGNAIVPTYVLEYLLGQYCATDDEETILQGVQQVKNIIAQHFVHRDEAQLIKSTIRDKGSHRIIDKVSVQLNETQDCHEAYFANLGLKKIPINDDIIRTHKKLLSGGVWCIVTMGYISSGEKLKSPWVIESLKPIQVSHTDLSEFKFLREKFSKEEWVDILMQTIGLNPAEFTGRSKLIQLSRLVPYAENNYNLIELGPKGTGKSHIYSEMSPHGILISGGEVTKAKLFVNNSTGQIGLVGYWDCVAYDEFAGKTKRTDKGLVDIMKNYMANKSFSRGTEVFGADASMVFVGNTDRSVPYMLKHADLFEALPKDYYDAAFLDRIHAYLPGWEVQKLRNEMFSENYGFNVDYLAEVLKELRKEDYMQAYKTYFDLSDSITTRDKDSISKTFSGLVKVIYPHGKFTEEQAKELIDFAIENRKRVKQQLIKMDETFEEVDFSYRIISSGKKVDVETLEVEELFGKKIVEEKPVQKEPDKTETSLQEGHKIIRDNQTGVSYDRLFGEYLSGVKKLVVTDPYVRMPYQLRNFMEFAKLLADKKNETDEIELHLITNNEEEHIADSVDAFSQMAGSLEPLGIFFTHEFKDNLHDRSIVLDNGWKIILGRGLDIFQRTGGWTNIDEYSQEHRRCKGCEITIVSLEKTQPKDDIK